MHEVKESSLPEAEIAIEVSKKHFLVTHLWAAVHRLILHIQMHARTSTFHKTKEVSYRAKFLSHAVLNPLQRL